MDLRINKASSDLNTQYKQIEKNFVDIDLLTQNGVYYGRS